MRPSLFGIIFFLLADGLSFLHAQTATNVPPSNPSMARELRMISFLTPAQQQEYAQARAKALADNPALKTEGENLMQQGAAVMKSGTAADKQAFMEEMNSHRQKLRQAMLKEDSNLEPIFAEIDKHISAMKAKQLGTIQSSSGATNAPASGPESR